MSTVAFDFDGVIHRYSKGWHDGTIYDEPVEGIFELLGEVSVHHAIFVHTTRDDRQVAHWLVRQDHEIQTVTENSHHSGFLTAWRWDNGVQTNEPMVRGFEYPLVGTVKFWNDHTRIFVTNRKLPALAYVDDRAIRFFNSKQTKNELVDRGILPFPSAGRLKSTSDDQVFTSNVDGKHD